MKKTRVLHIITRLDKGGSAESTSLFISLMNHKKYEVSLAYGLSLESDMSAMEKESVEIDMSVLEAKGVRLFVLPALVRRLSFIKDLLALISIYLLIRQIRPHIAHTHTSKAGALGRLAACLAGVPVVVHTPHGHIFHSYYGPAITKIFVIAERILSFMTDKIIALTDRERDEHLEERIASIEKYIIVHSGVILKNLLDMSFDTEAVKKRYGIPQDCNVIGVIGRLVPIKGHKYLISAIKRIIKEFDNTVFVFVGDGYLESKLERQAESIGVRKNIIFTGWRSDVAEILDIFDVLVLPSLNEGMGKVLVEGMALGKPIVASRVGGIIDLVKNGENGILVPPRDPDALEEAILKLLRNNNLARELGKDGKAKVYPEYDALVMVRQIEDLYESLLISNCSQHLTNSVSGRKTQNTEKH